MSTRGTSTRDLLAGDLCKKPGIRYAGTPAQKVYVCFTLTADRSAHVELGWRYRTGIGCGGGGATYSDAKIPLDSPERINEPGEPGFTATIRGARSYAVLS